MDREEGVAERAVGAEEADDDDRRDGRSQEGQRDKGTHVPAVSGCGKCEESRSRTLPFRAQE